MQVTTAIKKMIDFYEGNIHDIDHFMKVWALAKTIGEEEGLDDQTQEILEYAAVVHDIACPLCRKKYGNTNGKNQELESEPLVKEFFEGTPVIRWSEMVTMVNARLPALAASRYSAVDSISTASVPIFAQETVSAMPPSL